MPKVSMLLERLLWFLIGFRFRFLLRLLLWFLLRLLL